MSYFIVGVVLYNLYVHKIQKNNNTNTLEVKPFKAHELDI